MKTVIHTDKLSKYYGRNREIKAVDDLPHLDGVLWPSIAST